MPAPIEASSQLWDPLATLEIRDPGRHCTCIGTTKNGTPCGNRVSKESRTKASHRLEIVASGPIDESLTSKLQAIAELLLCKRRHQIQVASILGRWHICLGLSAEPTQSPAPERLRSSHQSRTRSEHHQATREEGRAPGGFTCPAITSQQVQEVTADMVQQNQIPFHVSSTRRAVAVIQTATGHASTVVFRSFRKGREISDVECGICREKSSEDTVYLSCEECAGEYHWGCMYGWLTHRSPQSNFICPICRKDRLFDGFHVARPIAPENALEALSEQTSSQVEDTSHSVSSSTIPAHTDTHTRSSVSEATSFLGRPSQSEAIRTLNHPSLMEGVRRSTRATRRPEYYIPS